MEDSTVIINTKVSLNLFIKSPSFALAEEFQPHSGCPRSHKWLLAFLKLQEDNPTIDLTIDMINPDLPSEKYKKLQVGRRLPVCNYILIINTNNNNNNNNDNNVNNKTIKSIAETEEELENLLFLININFKPSETTGNVSDGLFGAIKNIFLGKSSNALEEILYKIHQLLLHCQTRYIAAAKTFNYIDCEIMVKLHHIFVCSKYLTIIEIPYDYLYIWRYLDSMYHTPLFLRSCPPDREILQHYYHHIETQCKINNNLTRPSLMDSRQTKSVPACHRTGNFNFKPRKFEKKQNLNNFQNDKNEKMNSNESDNLSISDDTNSDNGGGLL